ncbi:unnamed protein product [Linum tenue]|uniref:SAUR family protein n=1 Tax=Linum tenue TaxID=586396 RepID=A0AAV0KD42_9ROSI|nr:unnamed protein product [Linum tenue]
MAKVGKLTKLKSAIKKWPSFSAAKQTHHHHDEQQHDESAAAAAESDEPQQILHSVYVGNSRRRYLLTTEVMCHPMFQELMQRSGGVDADGQIIVRSEVVLFEHLLWMINDQINGGGDKDSSSSSQFGSMEELVDFYCC